MTIFVETKEAGPLPFKLAEPVQYHLAGDLVDRTFLTDLTTPTAKLVAELRDKYPGTAEALSRSRNWVDLVLALERAEKELERSAT